MQELWTAYLYPCRLWTCCKVNLRNLKHERFHALQAANTKGTRKTNENSNSWVGFYDKFVCWYHSLKCLNDNIFFRNTFVYPFQIYKKKRKLVFFPHQNEFGFIKQVILKMPRTEVDEACNGSIILIHLTVSSISCNLLLRKMELQSK